MKPRKSITYIALLLMFFATACAGNNFKGSASDRTGTNGATNGTGKIASGL